MLLPDPQRATTYSAATQLCVHRSESPRARCRLELPSRCDAVRFGGRGARHVRCAPRAPLTRAAPRARAHPDCRAAPLRVARARCRRRREEGRRTAVRARAAAGHGGARGRARAVHEMHSPDGRGMRPSASSPQPTTRARGDAAHTLAIVTFIAQRKGSSSSPPRAPPPCPRSRAHRQPTRVPRSSGSARA